MIYFVYNKTTGNLITKVFHVSQLSFFNPKEVDVVIY